jgi:predicted acyltransferase
LPPLAREGNACEGVRARSKGEPYHQLTHSAWHGWTLADTVFPSFVFIVGVSLTLSTTSRLTRGQSKTHLVTHALQGSLLIFWCGVVVDYLRVPIRRLPFVGLQNHLQLISVLQKIAVCYLVAFHIHP